MTASLPAAGVRRNHGAHELFGAAEKVRPGGDAGLVRPTYPEARWGERRSELEA